MARVAVWGGIAAALAALYATGAAAQLTGEFRDIFVDSSIKGCVSSAERAKLPVPAETVKAFCTCMANKQADMTTDEDLGHYAGYHELSQDYQRRIAELAPHCKQEVGIDK